MIGAEVITGVTCCVEVFFPCFTDFDEFFPDLSLSDLTAIIKRYKENDAWAENSIISKKDFEHLQEIMKSAGELDKKAPYNKLILQD